MSIHLLRRIVVAANVFSVVALVATVLAFSQFRSEMGRPRKWPSFTIDRCDGLDLSSLGQTGGITIPFGLWRMPIREVQQPDLPVVKRIRMEDLGTILAVVAVRNAGSDGLRSSVTFRKKSGEVETLAVGDAIETSAHPHFGPLIRIPSKYQLVACEADPRDKSKAHLLFDMQCDQTDLQAVEWSCRSGPQHIEATPRAVEEAPNAVVISEEEFERHRDARPRKRVDWKAEVEAVQTTTYRPRGSTRSEGIVITRISRRSQAAAVGLRADDVILAVNGRAVTSKAQAIKIGRDEVENVGRKILEVRMLRDGREITRRFDVSEHR